MATAKKTGTALAKPAPPGETAMVSVSIESIPTAEQIADAIEGGYKLYFEGENTGGSILVDKLRNLKSGADLFSAADLEKVQDHLGETVTIMKIDSVVNADEKYADQAGLGIFLVCTVVDSQGESAKWGIGAQDPVGVIVGLHDLGLLPWKVSFELAEKPTKRGFRPINTVSRTTMTDDGEKLDF